MSGAPKFTPDAISAAVQARRKALSDLMHSRAMNAGDIADAVRQITETAADCLELDRTSVWRLVDDGAAIECVDLYERAQARHSAGVRIHAKDVPRYFEALERERFITAHDAREDPRTSEFRSSYLEPLGITAMLDAPVFVRGKMVGVVCHEHVGTPRRWDFFEELLAGTFADFVAHVIETADWQAADEALRVERDALEGKVDQRTAELKESESNLRALLDFSPISMVLTRVSDHKVAFANRRAAAMFEVPVEEMVGRSAPDHWVDHEQRQRFLEQVIRDGHVDDMEVQLQSQNGRVFWCRISAQSFRFGGEANLLGAMVDITDQKLAEERLRQMATHDALTGLYNRRYLEEVLRHEVERARRYGRPLTVAMLDADHFKNVNDSHGHLVGDEVLRALSARCRNTLRSSDVFGRYGGEEFVVVMPETSLDVGQAGAERMRAAVADTPVAVGELRVPITVSIGLAALGAGQSAADLLSQADAALYAAKQAGRNKVAI